MVRDKWLNIYVLSYHGFWSDVQFTKCVTSAPIQRWIFPSIGIPIVKIRLSIYQTSWRVISTMGFPIPVRWHLYIESGPCLLDLGGYDAQLISCLTFLLVDVRHADSCAICSVNSNNRCGNIIYQTYFTGKTVSCFISGMHISCTRI